MHLSILNFKNNIFLRSGLLWALIFWLLFDFFFRSTVFYRLDRDSSIGDYELTNYKYEQYNDKSQLRMVIFGDSHTRDGFNVPLVARHYGLDKKQIFNFGISSGSPMDMYHYYSSHRTEFTQVKIVIIGVSEWQFNGDRRYPSQRLRRFASLSERLQLTPWDNMAEMVLGYFSAAYDHREIWQGIIKKLIRKEPLKKMEIDDYLWGGAPPITTEMMVNERENAGVATINTFFENYRWSSVYASYLRNLVFDLQKDGKEVYLIQTPKSELYYKLVKEKGYTFAEEEHKRRLVDLADDLNVPLIIYNSPWPDEFFRDLNHLNPKGAVAFSLDLSQKINNIKQI